VNSAVGKLRSPAAALAAAGVAAVPVAASVVAVPAAGSPSPGIAQAISLN
jgi:hypothetical protein